MKKMLACLLCLTTLCTMSALMLPASAAGNNDLLKSYSSGGAVKDAKIYKGNTISNPSVTTAAPATTTAPPQTPATADPEP